jgi:hypothetical protein
MPTVDEILGTPKQTVDDILGPKTQESKTIDPWQKERIWAGRGGAFRATPEEVYSTIPQVAGGAGGAVVGGLGDIYNIAPAAEKFARSKLGYDTETTLPFSPITSESVTSFVMGEPQTEKEKQLRQFGSIVGSFASPAALEKGLGLGVEKLIGKTAPETERLAAIAEKKLGIELEPKQLKQSESKGSPGFTESSKLNNQKIFNREASKATGETVDAITPKFIGKRLDDLGKDYDNIFKRTIKADKTLVDDLSAIRDFERSVRPSGVGPAATAADTIINEYNRFQSILGQRGVLQAFPIEGEVIQRIRSELSSIARTSSDGNTRRIAGEFVEKLDQNFLRNHPNLKTLLENTNKKYAATKTLEELMDTGIRRDTGHLSPEKLGKWLSNNVYGFGAGTSKHPLTELGDLGLGLKMRAIWEGQEGGGTVLSDLLSRTGRLALPLRTQWARWLQRRLTTEGSIIPEKLQAGSGASAPIGQQIGDQNAN